MKYLLNHNKMSFSDCFIQQQIMHTLIMDQQGPKLVGV